MRKISDKVMSGERALYAESDLVISKSVFDEGESPLKHAKNIEIDSTLFRWKYPLWYAENIKAEKCTLFDNARAGIWYSNNISINHALIQAPKTFRKCKGLNLSDVSMTNAQETLWNCSNVIMNDVRVKGDYFGMNLKDSEIDSLVLDGNYSFDGASNLVVRNSNLISKDAFWNAENITVYDSFITGEYIGWNSKNIKFVNCKIESLQGFCYIENLVLENCELFNTTLSFEYSSGKAELKGRVESIINPYNMTIKCDEIGQLILEKDKTDFTIDNIDCPIIENVLEKPPYEV